jgi:GNAT superfamily N-acetyltransferase
MQKANIRCCWGPEQLVPSQLKAFYETAGFGFVEPFGDADVTRMFAPGAFGLFAFSDSELVGAARLFGDDFNTSWLAEICVAPTWRRKGVGRLLVDQINQRFGKTALYCDALLENVEFFKATGIKPKIKLNACRRYPGKNGLDASEPTQAAFHDDPMRCKAADFVEVSNSVGFSISVRGVRHADVFQKFFCEGVYGSFAEDMNGRLVGFVRAFCDGLTKCYLAEVCVHPDWQRKGIGRSLVARMIRRFPTATVYTEAFPDAIRMMESCGVVLDPGLVGCSRAPIEDRVS